MEQFQMFAMRNLSVLNYAQGFTLWVYKHSEDISQILQPGFFNSASDMMATGDVLMISARDGGAQRFVSHSGGGVVTLVEMS
jgi:hypothetical protein